MTSDDRPRTEPLDPRGAALARYLRAAAASFSLSADLTDAALTAEAGMALLDAAVLAEAISPGSPGLRTLSEAGLFESMPEGRAAFVETPEIRAAIRRLLVSDPDDGAAIVAGLVSTASELAEANHGGSTASDEVPLTIPLNTLSEAVRTSRQAFQRSRQGPISRELDRARGDLVLVLAQYVDALESRHLPVPHSLRAELQLHRGLLRLWR